jgi:hypothetical protein
MFLVILQNFGLIIKIFAKFEYNIAKFRLGCAKISYFAKSEIKITWSVKVRTSKIRRTYCRRKRRYHESEVGQGWNGLNGATDDSTNYQ